MNNIISIVIILLVFINIYTDNKHIKKYKSTKSTKSTKPTKSTKSTKQTKSTKSTKSTESTKTTKTTKTNPDLDKQEYIINTVKNLTSQVEKKTVSNAESIHLISAYTTDPNVDDNFAKQFSSVAKKLQTIDNYEIKGRDFIKTNFVDNPITSQIVAGPSPAPSLTSEIIGITNAPMYAPVESIDSSVDIFLINQINTTKNNSVSYLDQPIITMNNKANYIKNNTSISQININKSVENVVAFSFKEKPYTEV